MISLKNIATSTLLLCLSLAGVNTAKAENIYTWHKSPSKQERLADRVKPPAGYTRVKVETGSFASWLRGLPMKPAASPVMLYNGFPKPNQWAHLHVIDIDTGKRDLQQCADAIMRLRAEYLYSQKRYSEIAFNYTNGKRVRYKNYTRSRDYARFKKYMTLIFAYAGTYSLSKELKSADVSAMKIGDTFIQGGFPGHAVLVADMVENKKTGEKKFLLVQSYMPAQDIHILKNPQNPTSPWYDLKFGNKLITPEWTFKSTDLKRFN